MTAVRNSKSGEKGDSGGRGVGLLRYFWELAFRGRVNYAVYTAVYMEGIVLENVR